MPFVITKRLTQIFVDCHRFQKGEINEVRIEWSLKLQLHGAIYRPDSFVMMLRYCATLKAIRYESTSLNRILADKSHRVIVALKNIEIEGVLIKQEPN